jgi:uncharacterized protein YodC (DUF2158 family)
VFENSSSLSVGDAVALKSGGPVMRLRSISPTHGFCEWAEGSTIRMATFPLSSLSRQPTFYGRGGADLERSGSSGSGG